MSRGIDTDHLARLLAQFGHTLHDACAIDIDPSLTSVYAPERDANGTRTGRVLLATYDTATGEPHDHDPSDP